MQDLIDGFISLFNAVVCVIFIGFLIGVLSGSCVAGFKLIVGFFLV